MARGGKRVKSRREKFLSERFEDMLRPTAKSMRRMLMRLASLNLPFSFRSTIAVRLKVRDDGLDECVDNRRGRGIEARHARTSGALQPN